MYNRNYNPLKTVFPFKPIKNKRYTATTMNTIPINFTNNYNLDIYAKHKRKKSMNPLNTPLNFNLKKKSFNNKRNQSKEVLSNKNLFKNRKSSLTATNKYNKKSESLIIFDSLNKKSENLMNNKLGNSKKINNLQKIKLQKIKSKKVERKNFLNFFNDINKEFYKKKNNYSNHLISKNQKSEKFSKNTKKTLKELFKVKIFEMTSIFSKYKFFSCNCELIRVKNGKCISISNFLNLLKAPSDQKILSNYQKILKTSIISPDKLSQIHKDIKRTYSNQGYFNSKTEKGFKKLERLLVSISRFKKIGYVQGMNFIAASFLWHCEEEIAYFIIIKIFEIIEAEKYYTINLSGIIDHCKNFWKFLKKDNKEITDNLENKGILSEMILPEWFITLGSNIVPLKYHVFIFRGIIYNGWDYFYDLLKRVLLQLFPFYEKWDFSETLLILKLNKEDKYINWYNIFN